MHYISEDKKIELFNCDNIDLMKKYPDKYFDLAIVDPPYGENDAIDLKNNEGIKKQASKRKKYIQFENIAPPEEYWNELFRVSKNWIVWGGNFFGLKGGAIVWNKNGTAFGEAEIAICSTHKSVRIFEYTWNGMIQADMKNKEVRIHQTQKPVALYKYILTNYAKPDYKILDTHFGSLSIGLACHDYGFNLVACELLPEIYSSGLERLINHKKQARISIFDQHQAENFQQLMFDEEK